MNDLHQVFSPTGVLLERTTTTRPLVERTRQEQTDAILEAGIAGVVAARACQRFGIPKSSLALLFQQRTHLDVAISRGQGGWFKVLPWIVDRDGRVQGPSD